jgi:hypothetical protein
MAGKRIHIDLEAYERLRNARLSPEESFSSVIKRARWSASSAPASQATAGNLLARIKDLTPVDDAVFDSWEDAQRADAPPEHPWKE